MLGTLSCVDSVYELFWDGVEPEIPTALQDLILVKREQWIPPRLERFGIASNIAVFAISSVTIASSNIFWYIGKKESWCPFDIPAISVGGWGYNISLFFSIILSFYVQ